MAAEAEALLHLVGRQIEEIRALPNRSSTYATLLDAFRGGISDHLSSLNPEALSRSLPPLLPLVLADVHSSDEETAAYALKFLGFILHHPSFVAETSEDAALLALESLVKLITTTKMKAICNLGVWCISIQQLGASVVKSRLNLILQAIIHALDNSFGSLSTTYEAAQALLKLSTQFSMEMRSMSNIWVPPLYRRLLSNNKRERNIAERCLLKTKSIICPPPFVLSMAISSDLKRKLLSSMMDMIDVTDYRQQIVTIQGWGWYISLLGSDALDDRHFVNKMLKVPERTFVHSDPQIQVATLVAWESLIDTLLPPQMIECGINFIHVMIQRSGSAPSASSNGKVDGLLRRMKVLMTPLHGIMSSKCNLSVHLRCLITWRYLLHKLDLFVNHPSVLTTTFWQILQAIFSRGLSDENMYSWNTCIDLLDEYLLSKVKTEKTISSADVQSFSLLKQATRLGFCDKDDHSLQDHHIKWLPWDINNLSCLLNMVSSIILPGQINMTSENRCLALNAALKIFRSILQGVQIEVKRLDCFDKAQIYMTTILKFTKDLCETMASDKKADQFNDLSWMHAQFRKVIREQLIPSIPSFYKLDQIGSHAGL